jgi:hypothetical protein
MQALEIRTFLLKRGKKDGFKVGDGIHGYT